MDGKKKKKTCETSRIGQDGYQRQPDSTRAAQEEDPLSQGARVKVDTNLLREGLTINFGLGGWENREMARLTIQTGRVRELFTPEVGVIWGKSQTV